MLQQKLNNISIIEKFKAINEFNFSILINVTNKSFNSEFIQICNFYQPDKPINSFSTDAFINKLSFPNANTQQNSQARLADFIKDLGLSQIEELLVNSRNRGKRHPDFIKVFENKFNDPTKFL